jgi:peptidoglycan/LPS O-acetylase OafA/YrhL
VVYLLSPFVARFEQVDSRIVWSLLGLRFVDIRMNFMYLNAAWWYFAMLIQFYLLFPLLFLAARKLGPWIFLLGACTLGFFVRYLFLIPYPQDGLWLLGGFAICRLPEFAFGMALGMWHSKSPARMERLLLGGAGLLSGVILYPAALQLYHNGYTYVFVDFATGACCCLVLAGLAGIISRFRMPGTVLGLVGAFSYGIYLIHHPYVIWLGLRIREQPIWMFLLIAIATLTVISAWGIVLEKAINLLINKMIPAKKKTAP